MKPCDDYIADLVSDLDGALSPEAARGLHEHLAACEACRAERDLLASTTALLEHTRDEPDDLHLAGFARRTALAAEAFRDRSPRGLWWSTTRGVRLALGACTAALAASVALFVVTRAPARHAAPLAAAPVATAPAARAAASSWDDDLDVLSDADDRGGAVGYDAAFDGLSSDDLDTLDQLLDLDPS